MAQVRQAMALLGGISVMLAGGCFGPSLPAISCDESLLCPNGLVCQSNVCVQDADADTDGSVAVFDCESWTSSAIYFDPCSLAQPTLLVVENEIAIDTSLGLVDGVARGAVLVLPDGEEAWVLSTTETKVLAGGAIRAIGERPLVIASFGLIEVSGRVDVSSGVEVGAGSGGAFCATRPADDGFRLEARAGSGGGGGAGTGGNGGRGGIAAVQSSFSTRATGGTAATSPTLAGGCSGGRGGAPSTGQSMGGGAVHFAAATEISIDGVVTAGGSGGPGGDEDRGGGSGGGGGGDIGLEAPLIRLGAAAALSANGGGGGGCGDENELGLGGDHAIGPTAPNGGAGASIDQCDGGAGGAAELVGVNGMGDLQFGTTRGGGGGGGGAGRITARGAVQNGGATVSPPLLDD